jgi:hypothetical protein
MDEPGQHPPDGGEHAHRELGPEHGRRGEQLLTPRRLLPRQGIRPLLPVIQHLLQGESTTPPPSPPSATTRDSHTRSSHSTPATR